MAGDAHWDKVPLLLHGSGANGSTTITDSSPSPKVVTPFGNAQISTAQSKFDGSSIKFDGAGDYLTLADSTDWDFGTGDFTIEMFARFTTHTAVMSLLTNYQNSSTGWSVQRRSDTDTLVFGNGDPQLAAASFTPTDGVWYHVAVCRSGTSLRLFVDGIQIGSTATNSTNIAGSTSLLYVGGLNAGGVIQNFNGHLDELRVTKGVARYTADFTPPTAPHPDGVGQVSGAVASSGTAAVRTVRAYRRDTGALVANTASDAAGNFSFYTPTLDELSVICLDDDAGTLENDKILRVIPA
jgi:hypothetical protein